MTDRIYVVTDTTTGEKHLRIADNASQAIRSIVVDRYNAKPVRPIELHLLMQEGILPVRVQQEVGNVVVE